MEINQNTKLKLVRVITSDFDNVVFHAMKYVIELHQKFVIVVAKKARRHNLKSSLF